MGAALHDCDGPPKNVMGAHFDQPSVCTGQRGVWRVRDSSCAAVRPPVPAVGAAAVPALPAEGYADLHNHLLAHIAFGETVFWGAAYGAPEVALAPIPESLRGPHQRIEAVTSAGSLWDIFDDHDEAGYPTYSGWPTQAMKTHQQSHVDWLFRAYQGGLRLLVVPAVNNQDMFGRGETRTPGWLQWVLSFVSANAVPAAHRTSNDMEALEHQVRAAHELAAWVAVHRGGWLEIAETPAEASALIAAGKLAIVLGSEVDHLLNCDLGRRCSEEHIRRGLTRLEALGLAVLFPTHHKVTQFGDAANFTPINSGPLQPCPQFTKDCAALGLTAKGAYLVTEMMRRGLLVDLGHAGHKPFDDTMNLLETHRYPAQMTHASLHPLRPGGSAEYTLTYAQMRRLNAVDGMVSLHSAQGEYAGPQGAAAIPFASTDGGTGYSQAYRFLLHGLDGAYRDPSDLRRGSKVAFAADWNGFAGWPYGRFRKEPAPRRRHEASGTPLPEPGPLTYPLALPPNLVPAAVGAVEALQPMRIGDRSYDFNQAGLANAGLSPDLLADMRLHGISAAELDPFYRGARGFIEMWQRARELVVPGDRGFLRWLPPSAMDLIPYPLSAVDRLVTVAPGVILCRQRRTGKVGALQGGTCRPADGSTPYAPATTVAGEFRNANSGLCLTYQANRLSQARCDDRPEQQWRLAASGADGGKHLQPASTTAGCLAGSASGDLELRPCGEASGRLVRLGNTFQFRSNPAGTRCLLMADRSLKDGAAAVLASCPVAGRADAQWEFDALRVEWDVERLFSTRALNGSVGWRRTPGPTLIHPVLDSSGMALCRVGSALGVVAGTACRIDGTRVESFDRLLASTPFNP